MEPGKTFAKLCNLKSKPARQLPFDIVTAQLDETRQFRFAHFCQHIGLIGTVIILFGFQGEVILTQPITIAIIATPLLIQTYGIFAIAYGAAWLWKTPFNIAAPCALIGTSNFFELAVAVAISLFGLNSGAALATVVGVLVEVPVMLSLVAFANRTQGWFAGRS